jgi:hypothetical protein
MTQQLRVQLRELLGFSKEQVCGVFALRCAPIIMLPQRPADLSVQGMSESQQFIEYSGQIGLQLFIE